MGSYEFLAGCYDQLTTDVGYEHWADFLEKLFARSGRQVHTVLDLACGTGSLTRALALRGYEMIGVDRSEEMLCQAAEKCRDLPQPPLFLCQSMEKLDLYGTVDACVCCLDSVNYVTRPDLLARAFGRVHLFLEPGGIFIFDINTPEKLRAMDGQVFLDETEDTYCVWRGEYSLRRHICTYYMDLFRRVEGDRWERGVEIHQEYAYQPQELEQMLGEAGFVRPHTYGDRKLRAPHPGEERIFFTARKEDK
mgnify:CR=1 FL=1